MPPAKRKLPNAMSNNGSILYFSIPGKIVMRGHQILDAHYYALIIGFAWRDHITVFDLLFCGVLKSRKLFMKNRELTFEYVFRVF